MKAQSMESATRRIESAPEHYRSLIVGEARFAVVRGARSVSEVEAYLPSNYALMESFEVEASTGRFRLVVIIGGHDDAGWTLDGYVIPRLASGLIAAEEIA
jgi:hypothetical protein